MSRVGRVLGIIAAALVLGFLAIQLVPVERTNPPVIAEPNWDTPETRVLAQRACFDCHSNETVWPWYSYVAPVSWLVARDTNEGREVLNFSEWGSGGEGREPWEMLEAVESGYMPPQIYLPTHPDANLTAAERDQLLNGLQATLSNSPVGTGERPAAGGEAGEHEEGERDGDRD